MSESIDPARPAVPAGLSAALADRYRLERELGHGGMATVYMAEDLKHHRKVAVKVLRAELSAILGRERFLVEIRLTAKLDHPHILTLLDSGTFADGEGEAELRPYYVMTFVEGESLRERLKREKQLPLEEALRITREVADALGYAHRLGVIHRDIKPENILLRSDSAVVADFGIAKAVTATGGERLTETGLAIGTPAYMSPEQAAGSGDLDGRSDIYSLGCVLYEMLVGEPPYTGPTPMAILARKLNEPLPRVSVVRDVVPPGVEAALAKALARTPADRFATAAEFLHALAAGATTVAPLPRSRARTSGMGAAALLVIAAGIWAVTRRASPTVTPDPNAIPLDSTAIAVLPFQVVGADSASPARILARSMGDLFELKVSSEFGRRIRHPGSVASRWRVAGGTLDSALSEETELAVARAVGAGRLVRGTVVALGDSIALSASMVDVATGAVRVAPVRVGGAIASQQELVDDLIVLLLARDAGVGAEAAPRLRRYKPEAIQAWLAGERSGAFSEEQGRYYRAALAADSTFVTAALSKWIAGESAQDTAELRYAWEHQDQLTERGRAYLQVLAAGRHGSVRTMAGKIAAYEELVARWPEWGTAWGELAGELSTWGAMAGVQDWRHRTDEALSRVATPGVFGYWHLTELAFLSGDTARAGAATDSLLAKARGGGWFAPRMQAYRWRLAILRGDTAGATRVVAGLPDSTLIAPFAMIDARGIAEADRVAAVMGGYWGSWIKHYWGWARGRERPWREKWRDIGQLGGAAVPVYGALLLGQREDTLVVEEVRLLERMARDEAAPHISQDEQALARCWLTLWRLVHGDTTSVSESIRRLESDPVRRHSFAGWTRMFEVLVTEMRGGDVRKSLLRMDSVVRELPLPTGLEEWWPWPAEVQNLMLARMLGRYGEPKLALEAARRRPYAAPWVTYYIAYPEYLREEGRLAAEVGDIAGAVRAYNHYLALRENPESPWRAARDSVRMELAALVSR